jgi:hypothetical protein
MLAHDAASRLYRQDVNVDVALDEGSLIARITVVGAALFAAYGGVANYKGFKESVAELCNDAHTFGMDVCGAFVKRAEASPRQAYRVEKRLKTPGKLDRVIKRLEKLNSEESHLSPSDLQRQLSIIRQDLVMIERDLSSQDAVIVTQVLRFERLPPRREWPDKLPTDTLPRIAMWPEPAVHLLEHRPDGLPPVSTFVLADQRRRLTYRNTFPVRGLNSGSAS